MRPLSKADQLKLRAMEAGFQNFEADAFANCLRRFEQAIRDEYEVVAWMDADNHVLPDKYKKDAKLYRLSLKDQPFSGYDTPVYKKKEKTYDRTI